MVLFSLSSKCTHHRHSRDTKTHKTFRTRGIHHFAVLFVSLYSSVLSVVTYYWEENTISLKLFISSLSQCFALDRPAQLAELPRSEFDPELFPHSAYVKFFVTFATKVPYLTFCDKMWQFWYRKWIEREEIKRKWGNLERFLSTSSFSLHFRFIFSFSLHFLERRRATQVRDNHHKLRSILNNRKDKHQRYRWEMHITQWRQSTCLRNPWVISVTEHKSCVCVFVTDF